MRKILNAFLAVTFVAWASASPASALTFTLDTLFSGPGDPSGDVTVTITDIAGGVSLTFDASALTGTEFVTEWDLSIDPFVDPLTFTYVSGATATTSSGLDSFKADGDGFFDIQFLFASSSGSRLGSDFDTSVYTILGAGLDSADFLTASVGGGKGGFFSAAHVQGVGTASCSGWIGDPADGQTSIPGDPACGTTTTTTTPSTTTTTPTTPTGTGAAPEPTLLTLLGGGLLFAGRRLRRRAS